ncbi:hypothetical protein [Tenacibaculum singaporense]|uniref:hypothetical protein n=1 Tax=Tenacibaculum singaporense TaxID=2358479 RepID=UPI000F688222|nr:hypothetical protein [Tenacibaculum singaporense]RSC92592.1 hypothetical protein EI424_14200 [Tenacibaculum singaporense]
MKKKIIFYLLIILSVNSYTQLARSTIKYIPIKNISGWESKKDFIYFNSDLCEQSYYSIKLTGFDISIKNEKKLWKKYSPFLYIKIEVGTKEYIKIVETANISKSTWDNNSVARSVNNLGLIGPFPYLGEDVKITVNLYAYKVKDNLETAINSISNFTGLFPNQLNTFIEVSKKVKQSLDQIIPKCRNIISYSSTWNPKQIDGTESPNLFKEGYFIIHPIDQNLNVSKVYVNNLSQIKYKKASNVETYLFEKHIDHIVVKFEHYTDRRDFQTFSFFKKYNSARVSAINSQKADMEKSFKEAMAALYVNDNFTFHNKMTLHNKLYKTLLVQIRNSQGSYVGKKTPITACTNINNLDYQVATNTIREKLIEEGIIQPGKQIVSYSSEIGLLSEKSKKSIEQEFKSKYKIEETNLNNLTKKLDKPKINFKEKNMLIQDLKHLNSNLNLNLSDDKIKKLMENLKKNDIHKIIN